LARIYISVFETVTGINFALERPDMPVLDRIRANLQKYL